MRIAPVDASIDRRTRGWLIHERNRATTRAAQAVEDLAAGAVRIEQILASAKRKLEE